MSATTYNTCSIFTDILFALLLLWKMQGVTSDWNMITKLGAVKFVHRIALCMVSIFLMFKAGWSIDNETGPRAIDLIGECLLMMALIVSTYRHKLAIKLDTYMRSLA